MNVTTVGIILIIYAYSLSSAAASFGGACTDNSNCTDTGQECADNGTCACDTDNLYIYDGSKCTKDRYLGESCIENSHCSVVNNSQCSGGICSCISGFYKTANGQSGTCTKRYLGESCSETSHCSLVKDSQCSGGTCSCKSGYYKTANGQTGTCTKRHLGDSCTADSQCSEDNSECRSNTCSCKRGYYQLGSGSTGTCTDIDECDSNPCKNGGTCSNLINAYSCTCSNGYSDTNCQVAALGSSCLQFGTFCADPNASCQSNGGGWTCQCKNNYYDSNGGGNIGGTCTSITDLRVKSISFSAVTTSGFTVSWTPPSSTAQINRYEVKWSLKTSDNSLSGGNSVAAKSLTSFVINTGVTAGKTYIVKVMSVNTDTRKGYSRTTFLSKEQASKPSIPGALTSSVDNLDALDEYILIKWTAGNGVATMYKVKLLDGETEKDSKETSNLYSWFSSRLNGHNYSVVITARSEQFNGDYIWSEERVSSIKTKVQVPEAPRKGVCKSPTDSTITLNWDAPTLPNGDLVRYYIDVRDTSNKLIFSDETNATETEKVVGNLQPGTNYVFRLYTENEQYNSTSYDEVSSACKTRAKMSDPPTNVKVSGVTSRGFDISWEKPNNTYNEENYGYVLQIKDDEGVCWIEVIYRCSNCSGRFTVTDLTGLCDSQKQPDFYMTKAKLARALSYNASLDPDINYTVTVTAITDAGRGYPATKKQRTNEEAPQTPYGVNVMIFNATALYVTWKIDGPRPGKTDYLISLLAEDPARSKNFTITGFDVREYTASGLEEYWNYNVLLTVSTSVGSRKSEVTNQYRTLPAAPGKVSEFNIKSHPGGDYTKMKISWKMPTVLERNGIITSYKFEYFETAMVTSTIDFNQAAEGNIYTVTIDVTPEEIYNITVYAINEDGMEGEKYSVVIEAPAGVPINIEDTQNISIIPTEKARNVGETKITVSLLWEFFTEATNGRIQGTGLIICSKKDCGPKSAVKTLTHFNYMKNLKEDKEAYRPTNEAWLIDTIQNNAAINRRKRSLTYLEYTVGSDKCPELTSDQYCNGPLQTGKSYYIFAVSCTNGGCLVSEPNGPFITKAAQVTEECNCSTQSVVIGAVLGLIILILLVYAGYTTITIRRIRIEYGQKIINSNKNRHTSQTYVNETFGTGLSGVLNERNVEHPGIAAGYTETEYSTLDNDSREDKATYDILIPGYEK